MILNASVEADAQAVPLPRYSGLERSEIVG